jgi:S-DNA-T family DNA segregation ATPase FtsK/SpoIIIE
MHGCHASPNLLSACQTQGSDPAIQSVAVSTVEYNPREAKPLRPPSSDIVIASPIKREEKGKVSPLKIVLGLAIGVLMVFFLILMFVVMGRQPNPMMLMGYTMMFVMMVGGVGAALMQGLGGGDGELDRKRQNIDLQLAESAIDVHETASVQQAAALHFHPNPGNVRRLIEQRAATFWSGDVTAEAEQAVLRIGVGTARLSVDLNPAEGGLDESQEHLYEEYSAVAVSRFRSLMSVVPEVPLAREMSAPAYGFRGPDQERINGLVRSILVSASFKYSPNKILIGVISRDTKEWGWAKWLPHSRDRRREPGPAGYRQLAWRSYDEFLAGMAGQFDALHSAGTRMYVVVDDPDVTLRFPAGYVEGIPGVTLLAANVHSDAEVTDRKHRMRVEGHRLLLHQSGAARADYVTRFDAELIARAMAPIRPRGFGYSADQRTDVAPKAAAVDVASLPAIMDYLNIGSIDDFDLKSRVWDPNEYTETLESMFGYVLDENDTPTGELAKLDLFEVAAGGTGPHGMMSGGTGTGKSFMMTAILLGLILANSPSKLRVIMADFKGGATWKKFRGRIGHEVATVTNLENALDLLERMKDILTGELNYRQRLFDKYPDVDKIGDYRALQKVHPEMENLPFLLFIADEVHEFLGAHPEYKAVFEQLGRVGRSLGLLVLLASQYLDEGTVGDFVKHAMYGISLKVTKPSESKTVLKGNEGAIRLPAAMVALYAKTVNKQDLIYQRVMAWNWEKPYMRPISDTDQPTPPGEATPRALGAEVHTEDVTEFGMYHRPDVPEVGGEEVEQAQVQRRTEETGLTVAEAGIRLVQRCSRAYRSRELWTEPLRHPLSLHHIESGWTPEPGKLQLRIGDVDVPLEHRREPMVVDFSGSQSNALIAGGNRTGKTNTLRAMIAASARFYPANYVSWYIYDYADTDMACMSTWPNVGGYATRTDEDMFSRLWGEIHRIIELRTRVIGDNRIRTFEQYLAKKGELGVEGDPYGHIFFAVDGLDRILDDAGMEYIEPRDEWVQLLANAPRAGVHVVYTTRTITERMPKLVAQTNIRVFHNMEDPQVTDPALRAGIKAIPITMPGGSINADRVDSNNRPQILRSRVLVPISERIQPDGEANGMPSFKICDYSARIEEVGVQARTAAASQAPAIHQVPNIFAYSTLIEAYKHIDYSKVRRGARVLPMGVDRATSQPLALELAQASHMFVAGTGHAGVTTTLRTAINSVTAMYTPDEATVVIIDEK